MLAFDPAGRLLAVAGSQGQTVELFAIRTDGGLYGATALRSSTGSGILGPWALAFNQRGGLLAVANAGDSTLSVFGRG